MEGNWIAAIITQITSREKIGTEGSQRMLSFEIVLLLLKVIRVLLIVLIQC